MSANNTDWILRQGLTETISDPTALRLIAALPAPTAADARAWVAKNDLNEIVDAVVATAPPLPAGVADIWWRAAHSVHDSTQNSINKVGE